MNWREAFPREYLAVEDLRGKDGQSLVLRGRVKSVQFKDVPQSAQQGGGKKKKLVMYFEGKQKGLVLNVSICEEMSRITGTNDVDDWRGASVELFETTTRFGKDPNHPCIRVRAANPSAAATAAPVISGNHQAAHIRDPLHADDDDAADDSDDIP